jgi:putative CocE/NonD family hydrolase
VSAREGRIEVVKGVPSGALAARDFGLRRVYDVLSPMRDGVHLSMDLLRPDAPGRFPVILMRTPYNKVTSRNRPFQEDLARQGYIVAIQDCRGRFNSDGVFDPYRQEHADGFDTIEWLAAQEWCDGNVGMIGLSYNGQTQWLAASEAPRALKAIVPACSPPGHPFLNEPLWGGVMLMAAAEWMFAMGRRTEQVSRMLDLYTREHPWMEALPLSRIADLSGTSSPWWREWLSHPTYDDYWRSHGYEDQWPRITVPALNITGWWDMNFLGAPRNFTGMRRHGATRESRDGQRLVIGPWPHWINQSRELSGWHFGPDALTALDGYTVRFLDYWVRGQKRNGLESDARAHVFVIGANEWWAADEWPLPGTEPTPLYLHSGGSANSHRGNGTLSLERPGEEPCDRYDSDPQDPIRVLWSLHEGPVDDRPVTARSDVLCYTSGVFSEPMDVVGDVTAVLYASSSARDCDWHVRLTDVHPDGSARFLCHGVLRSRFRHGFEKAVFLEPGRIERFDIDMTATGVRVQPGHRLRIEIASSWFSRFERNPQTGAENWMTDEGTTVTAKQAVWHDAAHPSHVLIPVIRRSPG